MDTEKNAIEVDGVMYLNAEFVKEKIWFMAEDLKDWSSRKKPTELATNIEEQAVKLSKNGKRLGRPPRKK